MTACAVCGRRRSAGHQFCPGCGTRFECVANAETTPRTRTPRRRDAPAQALHERKQVSVLFGDLCGSTERVDGSDPEEAQAYLEVSLRLMSKAVEDYGGTVSQLLGDGLLALFGAPVAQEDHALRACLAAIAMQQRAREQLVSGGGHVMRIGIHSGEVVVGTADEYLASHYRADGSAIHLASRLERMAAPGTVLISEATFRDVAEQLDTVSLGPQPIRGLGRQVEVFELATSGQRSAAGPLARRRHLAPLIGRAQTLEALDQLASQVRSSGVRIVGVRGEAGIGKSRLLAEFCAAARANGFGVCTLAGRAHATDVPYGVVCDLIRELMSLPHSIEAPPQQRRAASAVMASWPAGTERHQSVVIDLLELGEADPHWQSLTPSQRRHQIAETLHWLIAGRLASGPLVILIDDIYLADRDSQRLLEALMRRLERLPVLLFLGYRQDFVHRWTNAPRFVEQWVGPLTSVETRMLAGALLGDDPSLRGLVDALVERADGNPFFLEQLSMTLVDDGSLVGTPGAYRCVRPAADLRVPGSIMAVVGARVDRLPAASKAALEAAAVVGEPIGAALIGHMQQVDADDAARCLQLALSAGLLMQAPGTEPPGFAFRHALVQEVVASTLTGPRRRLLHRAAFAALRACFGEQLADRAAVLAHHAYRGEAWAEAAECALRSMSRSIARSANRDALRMFALGLDAARRLDSADATLKAELGLRLEALGALLPLNQMDAIITNLERAEAITSETGDTRRQAGMLLQLAAVHWTRGNYHEGLLAADRAASTAVAAGSRGVQMAAVQARMLLNHGLGHYAEVVDDARRVEREFAKELSTRQIMPGWAVVASVNVKVFLADVLWRMGEFAAAQESCGVGYRELDAHEHAFSRVLLDFVQAEVWLAQQRPTDAARQLEGALRLCREHDLPTMLPPILASLCGAKALAGHAAVAAAMLDKATADRLDLSGGRYNAYYFPKNRAIVLNALGRQADAIDAAAAARSAAASFEQLGHEADALFLMAELESAAGRGEAAGRHYEESRLLAERCAMTLLVQRIAQRVAPTGVQASDIDRRLRAAPA